MTKEDFKTKCPLCMIGFGIICKSQTEILHLDIIWTAEAGLQQDCQDPEAVLPHVVPNETYGTKFSLSKEFKEMYDKLEQDFLDHPERFSKENIKDLGSFFLIAQAFLRYGDYIDGRDVKDDANDTFEKMYEQGSNLREIMEAISEPKIEKGE